MTIPPPPNAAPSILIVDDHPGNLLSAEAVLEPLGYAIVKAASAMEALNLALDHDVVTILLDVHMPDVDGYETAKLVRQREALRDVPIIFLTAVYDQTEHTHRGYALGAVDFLTKPFDPVILRAKVKALVGLYLRGQRAERARSKELERVKDVFLGAVGHDLRNPLGAILVAAGVIAVHPCNVPSHAELGQRVRRSAKRMNDIIEDVLDLTRCQFMEGIPVVKTRVDLIPVLTTVVNELGLAHPERAIKTSVPPALEGEWDAGRMARVFSNLIGNALQHSSSPSIQVVAGDLGGEVVVEVHNHGAEIPEDVRGRIFEPFRRSDTSAGGLGLGLFIVKEILRAHGGTVRVFSTDEAGTTFTVKVPKVASVAASSRPRAPS